MENYLEANKITKAGLARIYELTKAVVENKMKQEEAVKINYEALRFLKSPTHNAECIAVRNNAAALKFVKELDKDKMLECLSVNFLVIKYIIKEITKEELETVLKEVLSKDDVDETYVRDYITYNTIDNNDLTQLDKITFIYRYGSKKAKKIAVDEKLKMR